MLVNGLHGRTCPSLMQWWVLCKVFEGHFLPVCSACSGCMFAWSHLFHLPDSAEVLLLLWHLLALNYQVLRMHQQGQTSLGLLYLSPVDRQTYAGGCVVDCHLQQESMQKTRGCFWCHGRRDPGVPGSPDANAGGGLLPQCSQCPECRPPPGPGPCETDAYP